MLFRSLGGCGTLRYRYVFCGRPSFLGTRFFFLAMSVAAQCPCTLVLQFPAEVYRSSGESVVLPELLKSVDVPKVRCVQFVRNGLVRVTYNDATTCEAAMSSGIIFRGQHLPVSSVSARSRLVYVRDLPAEVPNSFVKSALCSYGTVHEVSAMEHLGYPGLLNGTRLVKITLESDIPSSVRIRGFDCRVWYRGQPQACPICHSYRHRVKECPLNGLCRRCHQAGHVARECREPRLRSSAVSSLSVLVDPSTVEEDDDSDVAFESADESEADSSISEGDEALASGDELVIEEESTDLPPRSSVTVPVSSPPPVSSPVAVSSAAVTPSVPKSSVAVSSSVATPIVSSKEAPSVPPVKAPKSPVKSPVSAVKSPVSAVKSPVSSVKSPVSSESTESSEVLRRSSRVSRASKFIPPSITPHAKVFKDRESVCGVSRIDFGIFTTDIIRDRVSFEYDRFVQYVHRGCDRPDHSDFGDVDVCHRSKRLRSGEPQKFPGQ